MPWFDGVDDIEQISPITGGISIVFWSSQKHFRLYSKTDGTASLEQYNDWKESWEVKRNGDISNVLGALEHMSKIDRGDGKVFVQVCQAWLDGYFSAKREFLFRLDEFRNNL